MYITITKRFYYINDFENEIKMTTLELAELVIWQCFDKVEPATKVTLNCYLFLMNEYSVKALNRPLTNSRGFCFDKNYPYVSEVADRYPYPGEIVPIGERPRTELPRELTWFLDGLIEYNKKNPFKIVEDCKKLKKSFSDVYNDLINGV